MIFSHRVALVTGGTSGIGAATARALTSAGARVFVASRTRPKDEALAELGGHFLACDVTDEKAVCALIEGVRTMASRLDLAVNAAGYEGDLAPLIHYPVADCRRVLDINVIGTFLCLKYELAAMRDAGGGAIVNLASIAGLKGVPNATAYTASKHAVVGLTRAAALESADVSIRVNAVSPTLVDTPMADRLSDKSGLAKDSFAQANPMHRVARAEEVAATICWLLSDEASFVSGQTIGVDGAQSAG